MHKEEKESSLAIAKRPWNGTFGALELGQWDDTVGTDAGACLAFHSEAKFEHFILVQVAVMAETWVPFIPSTNIF